MTNNVTDAAFEEMVYNKGLLIDMRLGWDSNANVFNKTLWRLNAAKVSRPAGTPCCMQDRAETVQHRGERNRARGASWPAPIWQL